MNKALSLLTIVALAASFAACSSDDNATETLNSEQVYFPDTMKTTIELSQTATSVDIPVARQGSDAIDIPLIVTMGSTNVIDMSVPDKVSFAQDSKTSTLKITYDPSKIQMGHYDTVSVALGKDYNTPYGNSKITLLLGYDPWTSLGKGKLTDSYIWEVSDYEVEIQQSDVNPSRFRIVAPFTAIQQEVMPELPPLHGHADYLYFEILKPGDTYNGTTVTQSDLVGFDTYTTGYYDKGYNDIIAYHPSLIDGMTEDNWVNNKVIQYQEEDPTLPAQVQLAPFYVEDFGTEDEYDMDVTGKSNMVLITFPGASIKDYSCSISYQGKIEDKNANLFAEAFVKVGADVASAKAAVVKGRGKYVIEDAVKDIEAGVLSDIIDVQVTDSGLVRIPMPSNETVGSYTVVIVTYDADGKAKQHDYSSFVYSSREYDEEEWTSVGTGIFTYKYVYVDGDNNPTEEEVELFKSETTSGLYKLEEMFDGEDFMFYVDANGKISFEDQYTGYSGIDDKTDLMVTDMYTWEFPTQSYVSGNTYYFNIGYYDNDDWWGYDDSDDNDNLETFVLTSASSAKGSLKKHTATRPRRLAGIPHFLKPRH